MANKISAKPRLSANGNAWMGVRIPMALRAELVAISERRGEYLNKTVSKALEQYVKADKRRTK